jgi:hypothetical protein
MTKFNPENKEKLSVAETALVALNIIDQDDAEQWMAEYIKHVEKEVSNITDAEKLSKFAEIEKIIGHKITAEEICKANIAMVAYLTKDNEARVRVQKLFKAEHPNLPPAVEEKPIIEYKSGSKNESIFL